MPSCGGCGVSYDDTFKFCPQCGRAKPNENKIISENYIQCPSCGHKNINALHYCQKCGKPIVNKCGQCGQKNPLTVFYCGNCGIKLSEAKFTITQKIAEAWKNKFYEHSGTWEYFAKGGICETTYFPPALLISSHLQYPSPITLGDDILIFAIPISKRNWCIDSVYHNQEAIINGLLEIKRNKIFIYNFQKNSRKYFLYEDLYSTEHSNDCLVLEFKKNDKVMLYFQIQKPSKVNANAINALSIGGSIFGSILSEVFSEKSNTDRQIESLRDEVKNLNPKRISASENAYLDYQKEVEDSETYVPMFKSFFDEILKKKKNL